jgi:hypothetical protein
MTIQKRWIVPGIVVLAVLGLFLLLPWQAVLTLLVLLAILLAGVAEQIWRWWKRPPAPVYTPPERAYSTGYQEQPKEENAADLQPLVQYPNH